MGKRNAFPGYSPSLSSSNWSSGGEGQVSRGSSGFQCICKNRRHIVRDIGLGLTGSELLPFSQLLPNARDPSLSASYRGLLRYCRAVTRGNGFTRRGHPVDWSEQRPTDQSMQHSTTILNTTINKSNLLRGRIYR